MRLFLNVTLAAAIFTAFTIAANAAQAKTALESAKERMQQIAAENSSMDQKTTSMRKLQRELLDFSYVSEQTLGAQWATTGAFADNGASLGVTRKLGYAPNGTKLITRRGEASQTLLYRMDRSHWEEHVRRDDIEIIGAEDAREVLGLT